MKEGEKVITEEGAGEAAMLGSSFLSFALPCLSKDELESQLARIRALHHKAHHIPYAFRLDGSEGFSEDGEPSGSSGRPLLEYLRSENAYGLLIVARYFGGVKLGVGNLRRMVVEAGKQAYFNANVAVMKERYRYRLNVDYAVYDSLVRLGSRLGFDISEPVFGERVELSLLSDENLGERLEGKGLRLPLGERFLSLVEEK